MSSFTWPQWKIPDSWEWPKWSDIKWPDYHSWTMPNFDWEKYKSDFRALSKEDQIKYAIVATIVSLITLYILYRFIYCLCCCGQGRRSNNNSDDRSCCNCCGCCNCCCSPAQSSDSSNSTRGYYQKINTDNGDIEAGLGSARKAPRQASNEVSRPSLTPTKSWKLDNSPATLEYIRSIDDFIRTRDDFYAPGYFYNVHRLREAVPPPKELKITSKTEFVSFLRAQTDFQVSADHRAVALVNLTPWRDADSCPVYGYFRCVTNYCKTHWESADSFVDKYQICAKCKSRVYPYKQVPIGKKM